ncbi:MAG: hypothetical protein SCK57_06115 [Bacillota bacterium]|nr:hypothetical protein [Bacillota bacterium]MDW7677219.1 hypothetical protein [Bacillota bacterium]
MNRTRAPFIQSQPSRLKPAAVFSRQGFISVTILLAGMILMVLAFSLFTRQEHETLAMQSSRNRVCAHYTAEAGMELMLWELYEWGEEVIREYEAKLASGTPVTDISWDFDAHVQLHLFPLLNQLNQHGDDLLPSPFQNLSGGEGGEDDPEDQEEESAAQHLRLKVESDPSQQQLIVTVQGICHRARVTQRAVVDLPTVKQEKSECNNFTHTYITSLYLVSRVQCPSPWE